MKTHLLIATAIMTYISLSCNKSGKQVTTGSDTLKDWELVWADEFDYTGLPDTAAWAYDVGGHGSRDHQGGWSLLRTEVVPIRFVNGTDL